ncbi:MAG: arginine--tRNA ligase [Pseudomonadota bacterium]
MNCIYQSFKITLLNKIHNETQLLTNHDYDKILKSFAVEITKDFSKGHISINLAMILCSDKANIQAFADTIIQIIKSISYIKSAEFYQPGFINIRFHNQKWYELINMAIKQGDKFGYDIIAKSEKINIEYISPNLTGPMHSGHQRIADVGNTIARCLKHNNYNITEECYFNDCGGQIDKFIISIYIRYLELTNQPIPNDLPLEYLGQYVYDVAKELINTLGNQLDLNKDKEIITNHSLKFVKNKLIDFFQTLKINFDIFTSEKHLHDTKQIEKAIKLLNKYLYRGKLKKLKEFEKSDDNELLLFKSSEFGDSEDRTVQKSNGQYTYFGAELAYFLNKFERGFDKLIMVVGHDHIGCKHKWHAVVKALNIIMNKNVKLEIIFIQLVKYIENNKIIDMSKRKGTFISAEHIVNTLGKDAIRIFMLSSKYSSELTMDFAKIKKTEKDNPVFYIQYAHVRICSIFRKALILNSLKKLINLNFDETSLNQIIIKHQNDLYTNHTLHDNEIYILRMIANWPRIMQKTIKQLEPNIIITYMIKLSTLFHALWNTENYKILDENNTNLTLSRLSLLKAIQNTLQSGFQILNVTAMNKM